MQNRVWRLWEVYDEKMFEMGEKHKKKRKNKLLKRFFLWHLTIALHKQQSEEIEFSSTSK